MRKDWKYILYLSLAFGIFVVMKLLSPKQYNWNATFAHDDKNPYGAFAFSELLPGLFPNSEIAHSYKTLYEVKDSLKSSDNIFVVSRNFSANKEDCNVLLEHVANGGAAFISAEYFLGHFKDTLGISTYDYFFKSGEIFGQQDSASIKFVAASADTVKEFFYKRYNIHNYFDKFDSTKATVIARNDYGLPITIRMQWGKGTLILNATPLAFTNIYLLAKDNHEFASTTLSYLPARDVMWTEYYQLGRREVATPLRFILTNEPLRWAYYITILALILFMIFEMKRKQRIIPIIKPLANTTLEFVTTIGNLYFHRADHKNIAEKKINFFMDMIRTKFWINTTVMDDNFVLALSAKTGQPENEVRRLVKNIQTVRISTVISAEELITLNKQLEKFSIHHVR
jgi:hypothetical protein